MLKENLVEDFTKSFRANWDRLAFSDFDGPTYTYGDVVNRILRLHYIFTEFGLKPGDKVALVGRNSSHWAITYLATVTYGAVIVPILPDFTSDEIHHIVNHSDSQLLFVSDQIFDQIDESRMHNLKAILALSDFHLCHCRTPEAREIVEKSATGYVETYHAILSRRDLKFPEVPNEALCAICYTSGTTGFSKGVMLPHNSLVANVRFFIDNLDLTANNRVVSFLPLAHAFGCAFEFIAPVVVGCHITFIEKVPTPKVLMEAFAEVKPRLITSVPLIIEKIYRTRIRPKIETPRMQTLLKLPLIGHLVRKKILKQVSEVFGGAFQEIVVGGAALNREVEDFFRGIGFPLANGYGMTECGPLISYTVVADNPPVGCVGKVLCYLECRIVKEDPDQDIGEVQVRGENVMSGYYKDEEATREAIDDDGWLHTGDLGHFDDKGFLYLTGRSKNMILSASGQNIYPEEIEAKLNNLHCVTESLILDDGGKLTALVYPDMEMVDEQGIGEEQLAEIMEQNRQTLNGQLASYSAVARIKLLFEEFEKTPTKKIKRRLYDALH